jgi:hypothetical protein
MEAVKACSEGTKPGVGQLKVKKNRRDEEKGHKTRLAKAYWREVV